MRTVLWLMFAVCLQARDLEIYWIDVEGGAATLIITPQGQSLLADSGNATRDDRDARRIYEVAQRAGLKQIDFLLTTHFHGDHVGGSAALSKLIPIRSFLDHSDSIETQKPVDAAQWQVYKTISAGKRSTLKPGDKLPLKGVESIVVSSNGQTLTRGGAANPFCEAATKPAPDATENQRSLGFLLTYGNFKFLDLGDLTRDKEMELACPTNKIGEVTVMQATHHGFFNDFSGAPAHVWAVKPRIIVVNNGPMKGWQPSAWETVSKIQGLEDVWQVHLGMLPGAHNVSPDMIANLEPTDQCKGHWLKATIRRDGTFTLTNSRTGFEKKYTKEPVTKSSKPPHILN